MIYRYLYNNLCINVSNCVSIYELSNEEEANYKEKPTKQRVIERHILKLQRCESNLILSYYCFRVFQITYVSMY
jgi:hypothetical protein